MFFSRHTRRLTAMFACLAILLVSLAPAVAHALAAKSGTPFYIEICTVEGARLIQVSDISAPESAPIQNILHVEHCPFCSLHPPTLGMPTANGFVHAIPDTPARAPRLFYHAPRSLHAWASVRSRAPPFA